MFSMKQAKQKKPDWQFVIFGTGLGIIAIILCTLFGSLVKLVLTYIVPLVLILMLVLIAFPVFHKGKGRYYYRRRIEQLADDLSTSQDGLSLDDLVSHLSPEVCEDICHELANMSIGRRSLKKAIEITGRRGYKRGEVLRSKLPS